MKLTMLLSPTPDASWLLARQAGVKYAVTKPTAALTGLGQPYEPGVLAAVKQRFHDAGLTLLGLEGDPFDLSRIKLGLEGRAQDLERYAQLLALMGESELNLLCYNFMARPPGQTHDWSRTRVDQLTRGGALTTAFRLADVPHTPHEPIGLSACDLWRNYVAFIRAVLPHAERAGVTMALHPDDPPIPQLRGMSRIFGTLEAFENSYRSASSPANGITFCQANFMLMPGDVTDHARHLADRIAFVHWRDVVGVAEDFSETFHDAGPHDMAGMLRLYAELGFTGPIRLDHAPLMHGEAAPWMPGYGTVGRLLAASYLRGLAQGLGIPVD